MSKAGEYVYGTDGHEGHWLTGEEIVRCRNCKRFALDNSDHDYRSGWWCHRWNTDMVKPDGFCAWGERVRAHVNSERYEEPAYLCDMCANGCDERKAIHVGQSAYDVCEKWQEVEK